MTEAVICRNQSIDLRRKSMDWFLYDNSPCQERVKNIFVSQVEIKTDQNDFLNKNK